jgi:hypothetical protein
LDTVVGPVWTLHHGLSFAFCLPPLRKIDGLTVGEFEKQCEMFEMISRSTVESAQDLRY